MALALVPADGELMTAAVRTASERRREVDGWRASGEGVRAYAARRGYSESTLRKWVAKLGRPAGLPGLVRLVAESQAKPLADDALVVGVGLAKILVPRSFDAAHLRAVVTALSETTP